MKFTTSLNAALVGVLTVASVASASLSTTVDPQAQKIFGTWQRSSLER